MKCTDLTGKKVNGLTVVSYVGVISGRSVWRCLCDCGSYKNYRAQLLQQKAAPKSCGCMVGAAIRKFNSDGKNKKHGQSYNNKKRTKTYMCWQNMKNRILNPNSINYKDYGGRGITISKEWLCFENFFADMGEAPTGLTLERQDNNKGYSKDNCKWATMKEQAQNRRENWSKRERNPMGRFV